MWRELNRRDLGFLNLLDQVFTRAQTRDSTIFPDFSDSKTVLVTSDYGGAHRAATFESYSFLILTPEGWAEWEPRRTAVRCQLNLDRRMSFKKLSDRRRRNALPGFLEAAGSLFGLSFSFLVSKQIESLFEDSGKLDPSSQALQQFSHWKPSSLERVFRVTHILAFLLSGLSHPHQDVLWFTDQDEIAANPDRLAELTRIVGAATASVVPHDMGHLRCGTSASDNGTKQLEDLIAIPDLIVGSLGELVSRGGLPHAELIVPPPSSLSEKSRNLLDWFSDPRLPLRRLVLTVEPIPGGSGLAVKRLRFHSSAARSVL